MSSESLIDSLGVYCSSPEASKMQLRYDTDPPEHMLEACRISTMQLSTRPHSERRKQERNFSACTMLISLGWAELSSRHALAEFNAREG